MELIRLLQIVLLNCRVESTFPASINCSKILDSDTYEEYNFIGKAEEPSFSSFHYNCGKFRIQTSAFPTNFFEGNVFEREDSFSISS